MLLTLRTDSQQGLFEKLSGPRNRDFVFSVLVSLLYDVKEFVLTADALSNSL